MRQHPKIQAQYDGPTPHHSDTKRPNPLTGISYDARANEGGAETTVAFTRRCGHRIFDPARRAAPARVINDTAIRFTRDDKLVNLTDLWKASGAEYNKRPAHWRETDEAQRFINEVSKKENVRVTDLFHITRGRFGGTFAHWQIALAYAKYLSPEFHILCNNIIRRFVEEEQNPDMAVDRAISLPEHPRHLQQPRPVLRQPPRHHAG